MSRMKTNQEIQMDSQIRRKYGWLKKGYRQDAGITLKPRWAQVQLGLSRSSLLCAEYHFGDMCDGDDDILDHEQRRRRQYYFWVPRCPVWIDHTLLLSMEIKILVENEHCSMEMVVKENQVTLAWVCPRVGPLFEVVQKRVMGESGDKSTANVFNQKHE